MNEIKTLNTDLVEQLLTILPPQQAEKLTTMAMAGQISPEQVETTAQAIEEAIDWDQIPPDQMKSLLHQIMPLETLVPDIYAEWRPVVRDAVAFVGMHLSPDRLIPKIIEQVFLPADLPLEQRLIILIAQMPSLQKIGQIVARNPNLEPGFRAELTRLENAIQDIAPAEVVAEIERQLEPHLRAYAVELQTVILAEASVSAVVRFTWLNPALNEREKGVFKVLKPYVNRYFSEELELLQGLADFFETNRHAYQALSQVSLGELFTDVRRLLAGEVDFPQEQATLAVAYQTYAAVTGVRTPRLIPDLSTPTITAATEEDGVKITEAFENAPLRRIQAAMHLIEALIAVPLFAKEEEAVFHADPHAGNLFVDEKTGEVILFDWALTERLSREQRRQLLLLALAVALRDKEAIFQAIAALSRDDLDQEQARAAVVQDYIDRFMRRLPPFITPGLAQSLSLMDDIVFSGLRFPTPLLIFRKVLFTLEGVLNDAAPGVAIDPVLVGYILKNVLTGAGRPVPWSPRPANFRLPLTEFDWIALNWSTLFYGGRLWLQTMEQASALMLGDFAPAAAPVSPPPDQAAGSTDQPAPSPPQQPGAQPQAAEVVAPPAPPVEQPQPAEVTSPAPPDDLKAIKGIGPVYQRKLRALGFNRYAQLAQADPDRLRQQLGIKAWQKVEPESWIEQARQLAG